MRTHLFAFAALSVALLAGSTHAITTSLRTTGTGASAEVLSNGQIRLATPDGTQGIGILRLEIPDGIALNAINSVSYVSRITDPGNGFAPEVVFNIDADGNGVYEGSGADFFASNHSPAALGGDNYLSGDSPQTYFAVEPSFVTRDAITGGYRYFSANDARDANAGFYQPFDTVLNTILPIHDIDATDTVFSIEFLVGSSSNFNGMETLFDGAIELNGTLYDLPELATVAGESFNNVTSLDQIGFSASFDSTGDVSIVTDPVDGGSDNALRLFDSTGAPVSASTSLTLDDEFDIGFDYLFDTSGKLEILLGSVLLDTIIASDASAAYEAYSQSFALADLGLTPGTYDLSLVLSNVADPELFIDDLLVTADSINAQQTAVVPEPASAGLALLALAGAGLALRRRR